MSISSEINRLNNAKIQSIASIRNKGVAVSEATKADKIPSLIDAIPTAIDNVCSVTIKTSIAIKPLIIYSAVQSNKIIASRYDSRNLEKNTIMLSNVSGTAPITIFFASPGFSFPTTYNNHKYLNSNYNVQVSSGIKNFEWIGTHLVVELNATQGSSQTITIEFD